MPKARLDIQKTLTERGTLKIKLDEYIRKLSTLAEDYGIPSTAKVEVEIPGGGDWSGMRLDADEVDIVVTWEIVKDVE